MALIPAVLAALACGALGIVKASSLLKRERLLNAWLDCFRRIEITLKTQRVAIDKVLETGMGTHPLIDERLSLVTAALIETPALTLGEAFQAALQKTPASFEEKEEKALLLKLFEDLGTGSLEKRRDLTAQGILSLQSVHETALERHTKNGRLYRNLGWLCGLALLLLML